MLPPPVAPVNTSSASGASSSSQGGNQDQSRVVDDRALNAPSNKVRDADDTKEELVSKERQHQPKQKKENRAHCAQEEEE